MRRLHLKSALAWLAPGVPVVAAVIAERVLTPSALGALTQGYPYAIFAAGILLAWRFHRSRVVAALIAVGLATYVLGRSAPDVFSLHAALALLLLPAALAVLSVFHDRGVLTLRGIAHIIGVPGVAVAVLVGLEAAGVDPAGLTAAESWRLWPLSVPGPSVPALAALVIALSIAVGAAVVRRKAVEKGIAWSIVAAFLAIQAGAGSAAATLYLGAAGLTLALSVIETSYGLVYLDELTGLPARRAFRNALTGLGRRYTIAMVDVDHFKRFNDRHGHDVGDQVLRMVAKHLAQVRGGGRAFRYGGEEFAVVFAGKTREETVEHLEELRSAVAQYDFTLRGRGRPRKKPGAENPSGKRARKARGSGRRKKLSVTLSIGVAERTERLSKPEEVLRAADKALYRAKRAGRNRVAK